MEIWQIARRLSKSIFDITNIGAFAREFKFKDQIRAAAGSVMDNIAEGFERAGNLEFINFLSIAKGSTGEVRSQLYRAIDQNFVSLENGTELIKEYELLSLKIAGFIKYLNRSHYKGQKFKDRVK